MSYPSDLVNTRQASEIIGVQPITLRCWRISGKGPRYYKFGIEKQAAVFYSRAEIQSWLAANMFASTSEASVKAAALVKEGAL